MIENENYENVDNATDLPENNSAKRVGARIRAIRKSRGLSLTELGQKVGLSADRMSKYETGIRKPKLDMVEKIATVLNVSPMAIAEPDLSDPIGIMYALFDAETQLKLSIAEKDNRIYLGFEPDESSITLYAYLAMWKKMKDSVALATTEAERSERIKEYKEWKWNFSRINTSDPEELQKLKVFYYHEKYKIELEKLNNSSAEVEEVNKIDDPFEDHSNTN